MMHQRDIVWYARAKSAAACGLILLAVACLAERQNEMASASSADEGGDSSSGDESVTDTGETLSDCQQAALARLNDPTCGKAEGCVLRKGTTDKGFVFVETLLCRADSSCGDCFGTACELVSEQLAQDDVPCLVDEYDVCNILHPDDSRCCYVMRFENGDCTSTF